MIIKVNKTTDYTVMSNTHLREKNMSLKAKGLLSIMLALPENWDYSIAGLVAICKEGRDTIETTLKELKEFGYLTVTKMMPNETKSGRIEYQYDVYEQPREKQGTEKQEVEKQGTEKQPLVFPEQLNKNKSITDKSNTDILSNNLKSLLSPKVCESVEKWLQYKKEKKQSYKPTGLKTLVNKLAKDALLNGDQYIIDAIEHSITMNYSGIYPEKTQKPATQPNRGNEHTYTHEEMKSLFTSIDDLDDIEV